MLLLSLGPDAIAALLSNSQPRAFAGPDLAWLLFGPDMMGRDSDHVVTQFEFSEPSQ